MFNWKIDNLIRQPELTTGTTFVFFSASIIFLEQINKEIDVQCVPDLVKKAITQYLEVGYMLVPDFLSSEHVELAFKECNYHTLSRDVDLRDNTTWENVNG